MILCVGTTPAAQRVMVFEQVNLDAVNRATTTLDGAAGKAVNVAKVLRALGEQPLATGFLGGDRGDFIRSALRDLGIEHDFVSVPVRTRQCVTVLDQKSRTVTELVEESRAVSPEHYASLMAVIRCRLGQCRAVVMSGTIAPGGGIDLYRKITEMARPAGILTVVDAQGPALCEALKAGPGLVKPNRKELAATVGRELRDEGEVLAAMAELGNRGAARVVVTAGAETTLAWEDGRTWRIDVPRIEAVNPIGSGDAFTAGLVWRLLRGDDLAEACRWAGAVGAANALNWMAGEVRREDVERLSRNGFAP